MPRIFDNALATFAPDADRLVARLAAGVDDAMLRDMAGLDRGHEVEANLRALRQLRSGGALPVPMPFEPREVLELTRWFRPDDEPAAADRRRGHAMRAFACAALLRASGEPGNHALCEGQNQTLVNLLWSLDALDGGHEPAAFGLLAWLLACLAPERRPPGLFDWYFENPAFLGVGMLWLGLHMRPRLDDPAVVALAEWIAEAEPVDDRRRHADYGLPPGPWLLGGTNFDQCHSEWRRLGAAILARDLDAFAPEAADWLRLIGRLLAE